MSDLISRQAARNALLNKGQHSKRYKLGETWELNLMEIEETLGELPSVEPEKCSDCISKQAVLEVQTKYAKHMGATKYWQMRNDIRALPPVTSQPKIGQWMECGGDEPWLKGYCCSLCNFTTTRKYDYCTCGAKMVEPQESEDKE